MKIISSLLLIVFLTGSAYAQNEVTRLKEYLNDAAVEVNNTDDPEEKREILDDMFHDLLRAFDVAEDWPLFSDSEKDIIKDFKTNINNKHDELNGYNGFERIQDKDLNHFASYTVHDFEQAAEYVTISVVALVLIILLVVLLL